jgi:uncharacterized repeat protein (TIGR01451 family)
MSFTSFHKKVIAILVFLVSLPDCALAAQDPALCVPPPSTYPTREPPMLSGAAPVPQGPVQEPPTPVVTLSMLAPAASGSGQEIEYKICIENCSAAAAHHVMVRDPLPANARFVRATPEPAVRIAPEIVWSLGTLAAGAKQEITLVLAPTGGDEVQNCARVQFEHGQCVTTRINRPSLSLEKSGPTQALLNDPLDYKLTLTNTGSEELKNVFLTDILPDGLAHASGRKRLSWIVGSLAAGQTQTVDYQVTARRVGKQCNKVIATAAGDFRKEMENCVSVGEARLELSVSGPKRHYLNTPATYQINVSNAGTVPLANVTVSNPLPSGTAFVQANEKGIVTDNQVQWSIGTLAAGAGAVFELVLRVSHAGIVCDRATAVAELAPTREAEVCTDFTGLPALSLEVEDLDDPIAVGATTAYIVVVRNPGTLAATNVRITATLPLQMELFQAIGPGPQRSMGQRISFDPVNIPAGGEARYRVEVQARRPGDVRFRVELTADQLTAGPVLQEESTTIYASLPSSRRKAPPNRARVSGKAAAFAIIPRDSP